MTFERRVALFYAIALPLLHTIRSILWWSPPNPAALPVIIDAFVAGAILLAGVWRGPILRAIGWGFCGGILYRSLFEQLADPTRHAGHEPLVICGKSLLLLSAVAGMVVALREKPI
jgi:hypothetical protein